jgi:hypothetical protein
MQKDPMASGNIGNIRAAPILGREPRVGLTFA